MANEITVTASVSVANGNLTFSGNSQNFRASQTTANGPAPGAVTLSASGAGTLIGLSQLTLPGWCQVKNCDATNYCTIGLYDGTTFRPFIELQPGEVAVFRLSRTLLTANTAADVLHGLANTAPVVVQFNCLDT